MCHQHEEEIKTTRLTMQVNYNMLCDNIQALRFNTSKHDRKRIIKQLAAFLGDENYGSLSAALNKAGTEIFNNN